MRSLRLYVPMAAVVGSLASPLHSGVFFTQGGSPCRYNFSLRGASATSVRLLPPNTAPLTVDTKSSGWVPSSANLSNNEVYQVLALNEPLPPSDQHYVVDVAPKGQRAACRVCAQPFPEGSLRVAMLTPAANGDFDLPRYCHSECLDTTYRKTYPGAQILTDSSKLVGLTLLSPALLQEAVTLILGEKGWQSFRASEATTLRRLRDQQTSLANVEAALSATGTTVLLAMLKQAYGKAADRYDAKVIRKPVARKIILAAVVDGLVFGKTASCDVCGGGMVLFSEARGTYKCTGHIDTHTQCTEVSENVVRSPWPQLTAVTGLSSEDIKAIKAALMPSCKGARKSKKSKQVTIQRIARLDLPSPPRNYLAVKNAPKSIHAPFEGHMLLCKNKRSPVAKLWVAHGGKLCTSVGEANKVPRVLQRAAPDFIFPSVAAPTTITSTGVVRSSGKKKKTLQKVTKKKVPGTTTTSDILSPISIPVVTELTLKHVLSVGSFMATQELVKLYIGGAPVLDDKKIEEAKQRRQKQEAEGRGGGDGGGVQGSNRRATVKVRGDGIPVDTGVPNADNYDVHSHYAVTLSKTDLATGKNSFYIMQVLREGTQYSVWRRWGRTGEALKGGDTLQTHASKEKAIAHFEKLFDEKTGNQFSVVGTDYSKFLKQSGLFSLVKMVDLSAKKTTKLGKAAANVLLGAGSSTMTTAGADGSSSDLQLEPATGKLLDRMFDADTLTATLKQFDINTDKMPLGNLSESMIKDGRNILSEAMKVVSQLTPAGANGGVGTALVVKGGVSSLVSLGTLAQRASLAMELAREVASAKAGDKWKWQYSNKTGAVLYDYDPAHSQAVELGFAKFLEAKIADLGVSSTPTGDPKSKNLSRPSRKKGGNTQTPSSSSPTMMSFKTKSYSYSIDFDAMKQLNMNHSNKRERAIRRVLIQAPTTVWKEPQMPPPIPTPPVAVVPVIATTPTKKAVSGASMVSTHKVAGSAVPLGIIDTSSSSSRSPHLIPILDPKMAAQIRSISSRFYTTIPQYLKQQPGTADKDLHMLNTPEKIMAKSKLLDDLEDIAATVKILELSSGMSGNTKKSQNYRSLNTDLAVLDAKGDTYKMIEHYFKTSQNTSIHRDYVLECAWEVSRHEEETRFKRWESDTNRKLLWHGSGFTNWVRILSQGLKIAPPEAPSTGYMFGKGIYFADMMSKSAGYCRFDHKTTGLIALAEVALGDMHQVTSSDSSLDGKTLTSMNKHSTFARGQTAPDGNGLVLPSGCVVPNGTPKAAGRYNALYHNEFIVYDVSQVRLRYLLEVKPK